MFGFGKKKEPSIKEQHCVFCSERIETREHPQIMLNFAYHLDCKYDRKSYEYVCGDCFSGIEGGKGDLVFNLRQELVHEVCPGVDE